MSPITPAVACPQWIPTRNGMRCLPSGGCGLDVEELPAEGAADPCTSTSIELSLFSAICFLSFRFVGEPSPRGLNLSAEQPLAGPEVFDQNDSDN
jgi:hypothetical protein